MSHEQRSERIVHKKQVNGVLMSKKGGPHGKSNKAKRQAAKHTWKNTDWN